MTTAQKVYAVVTRIPEGKVLTYGLVARLAHINNPRVVGNILHRNRDPDHIPCHRVVNAQGKVAQRYVFGAAAGQAEKLQAEGVIVYNRTVDLLKYLWINPGK